MGTPIRLNKHIATLGICSRRKADEYIAAGDVSVNGTVVTDLGTKIDPDTDIVQVCGQDTVTSNMANVNTYYIALNKPIDIISSASSEQGVSVVDLILPEHYYKQAHKEDASRIIGTRLYPVGRLDKDSEGLILLTNDGALTHTLTHPRYEHEKEYEVTIDATLTPDAKKLLTKGMLIGDEHYGGMEIKKEWNQGKRVVLTIVLREGKNRHIRKMLGALGYRIHTLRRTRIGSLRLGTLPIGTWKFVRKEDII